MTNKVGQCAFHGKNIRQEDWLTAAAWPWQAFEAATLVINEHGHWKNQNSGGCFGATG